MGLLVPFSPRVGPQIDEGWPPFRARDKALMAVVP